MGPGFTCGCSNATTPSLTGDVLVNTTVAGNQYNATLAMDAVGDFVVVWQSDTQDPDGSAGIYAQRFNSMGQKLGGEFRVNSTYTNNQIDPAAAMDPYGNFVVVWQSVGEPYGYFNDIHGQLYDYNGNKIGGEFRVNSQNVPGTGINPAASEARPVVAMDYNGNFVVAWQETVQQVNGALTNSQIYARLFDNRANPRAIGATGSNVEIRVNGANTNFISDIEHIANHHLNPGLLDGLGRPTEDGHTALNPQITIDPAGNFIIAWEGSQDNDISESPDLVNSYGIFFRRFNADGTSPMVDSSGVAFDHEANLVISAGFTDPVYTAAQSAPYAGDQINPSIAMDANGHYIIAWDGNGAQPNTFYPEQFYSNADNQGVFIRNFQVGDAGRHVAEFTSPQSRVNSTSAGTQQFASLAMTPAGQYIAVWQGNGVGDQSGIFARRYNATTDAIGPMAIDFLLSNGTRIDPNGQLTEPLSVIQVVFDEAMMPGTTGGGVQNPANYQLLKDGVLMQGGILSVQYGLDAASNKYIATVYVDGNGLGAGVTPLTDGRYQLVVLSSVRDKAGNPLQGSGLNPNGAAMSRTLNFTVPSSDVEPVNDASLNANATSPNATTVADDGNGDQVVVWVSTTAGKPGIYAKLYQMIWTNDAGVRKGVQIPRPVINPATGLPWANNEILITNDATATDAGVACNADGNFVVTWSAYNATTNFDVFAQRISAVGQPLGL